MQETLSRPISVAVRVGAPRVAVKVAAPVRDHFQTVALFCLLCVLWGLVLFVALSGLQ